MIHDMAMGSIAVQKPSFIISCGVIMLAAISICAAVEIWAHDTEKKALSWPAYDGKIIEHASHLGPDSWPLSYEYMVGTEKRTGHRVAYFDPNVKENLVDDQKYKVGESVKVYVDPKDPKLTVISINQTPVDFSRYGKGALIGSFMLLGGFWRLARQGNKRYAA